jgi:putative addiction module killer protein
MYFLADKLYSLRYYWVIEIEIEILPEFAKWAHGLKDIKAKVKIADRIDRMKKGNLGDHKSVGKGVSECRIDYGPGYRLYFGRKGNTLIIILAGSTKKEQDNIIKSAQNQWAELKKEQN